jgi:hypothetical protein
VLRPPEARAKQERVLQAYPGLSMERFLRPNVLYLGMLDGFVRRGDPQAEKLKQVLTKDAGDDGIFWSAENCAPGRLQSTGVG